MMMNLLRLLCWPWSFSKKKEKNLLDLPADITTEILSGLPIESVVECKRVCKIWRSLMDKPAFGYAHTRNHLLGLDHTSCTSMFFLVTKFQQPNHPWRFAVTYEFHCGNYITINNTNIINHHLITNDDQMSSFKTTKPPNYIRDISYKDTLMNWKIVGSSNGLICLSGIKGVYVYNPFTGEYVNLGHPTFKTSPRNHAHYNLYGKGFGYHPYTNEYKVVFIYYNVNKETGRKHTVGEVSVYTLGSGTWRTREDEEALSSHTHHGLWCSTPGVIMNGALHWIRPTMDGYYHEIVSFDLAEEKFISNIIMPSVPAAAPSAPNSVDTYFQLGLLGGCLCITQHNENSSDIWVMNNRDKSWTMKCKITQKDDWRYENQKYCPFIFHTRLPSYDPIALLGNGRKILLCGRKTGGIVLYDIETGDIDYDIMSDSYQYSSHDFLHIRYAAIPYVRSIISLKALGEEGTKKAQNDSFI